MCINNLYCADFTYNANDANGVQTKFPRKLRKFK